MEVQSKVFGTKSLAWEYENEIRFVFTKSGLKCVPESAVRAIYFGLNMSLEDRNEIIRLMSEKNIEFHQIERIEDSYKLKATKLLFDYTHTIVDAEKKPRVDNYIVLYESPNKDNNSIRTFVSQFREKLNRKSNITIIDDLRAKDILLNKTPRNLMSREDLEILSNNWIAYSSFDAPEHVWMYPEK